MKVKNLEFILVAKGKKTVLATVHDGVIDIHNEGLMEQMSETGIFIPSGRELIYGGKEVIRLNEPGFNRAFLEIFIPKQVNEGSYKDPSHNIEYHFEVREV